MKLHGMESMDCATVFRMVGTRVRLRYANNSSSSNGCMAEYNGRSREY